MSGSAATAWAPPVIYSITPDEWPAGDTTTFTISGAGFGYSPDLTITGNGVSGYTNPCASPNSTPSCDTQIVAMVTIDANTRGGQVETVTVTIFVALILACAVRSVGQSVPDEQKASFTMRINLMTETVKPGAEVQVLVKLTNTSAEPISLWRARSGPPPYIVEVFDRAGKEARLTPIGAAFRKGEFVVREQGKPRRIIPGGSGAFVTIAPGETAKDIVVVSQQVDLSQPGQYRIRLERVDPATKVRLKSNTATLTVAESPQ